MGRGCVPASNAIPREVGKKGGDRCLCDPIGVMAEKLKQKIRSVRVLTIHGTIWKIFSWAAPGRRCFCL
jgi:hypothetical protein